jgi:hypothetical protein
MMGRRNFSDFVSYHDNTNLSIFSVAAQNSKRRRNRALLHVLPCSHSSDALVWLPPVVMLTYIGDESILSGQTNCLHRQSTTKKQTTNAKGKSSNRKALVRN